MKTVKMGIVSIGLYAHIKMPY